MVDVVTTLDGSAIARPIKLAEIEVVRGAGGTPRGFRAHQNNLRRGRRTNEIRRTAPNRQTRHQKKGGFQQATSQKPKNPSADAITAGGSLYICRANQQAVQHRTQPRIQQPPTHIKQIRTQEPNINSRRNKHGPPEAIRVVPS